MRLRFTASAARQLEQVLAYIADLSPQGARHVQGRIAEIMSLLVHYPEAGSETARFGERRMVAAPYPYAVTYRIGDDEIIILGIRHTSRRSP